MVRRAVPLLVLLLAATGFADRPRLVRRVSPPPLAQNVLWIAAHPDDELLAAPILALYCREQNARCTIAVVTNGERGTCELPTCGADLGALREQELRASAALFSASVVVGSFTDGSSWSPQEVLARWNAADPPVRDFIGSLLAVVQPDLVLTLDPRHGSTCHPDHRAIGRAVVEASAKSGIPVGVIPTRAEIVGAWDAVMIDPNLARADIVVDAGRSPEHASRWGALIAVASTHASQFSTRAVEALDRIPVERRLVGIDLLAAAPTADECLP
jgi:LmbE family N-acetylglucosaminyl deacetylase